MKTFGHLFVQQITLQPGREWINTGRAWRFFYLSRGTGYWLGASKSRPLSEGEMLVIPPSVKGVVRASQIGQVSLQTFSFAPERLRGFFTLSERGCFDAEGAQSDAHPQFLPSNHPVARQFAALAGSRLDPQTLAFRAEALRIVAAVFDQEIARRHARSSVGTAASQRFHQLIAQIPDSEIIHHSPEQLARLCACSPRHFNRLFRKHFGISARSRQTELRLLKARELLRTDAGRNIIEIAIDSGYRNLSLFNALFKRRFGMTPSQWRHSRHPENRQASK